MFCSLAVFKAVDQLKIEQNDFFFKKTIKSFKLFSYLLIAFSVVLALAFGLMVAKKNQEYARVFRFVSVVIFLSYGGVLVVDITHSQSLNKICKKIREEGTQNDFFVGNIASKANVIKIIIFIPLAIVLQPIYAFVFQILLCLEVIKIIENEIPSDFREQIEILAYKSIPVYKK